MVLCVACGSSAAASYDQTHSAKQIVSDASKSTGSATSFHLAVAVTTQNGEANADFDVEGTNVNGRVIFQGTLVRVMHVDGRTFVYGADLAQLLATSNAQAASIVRAKAVDKWVLMPEEFWSSTGVSELTDMRKLGDCLEAAAGLAKKGTSTVSGKTAIEVDDQLTSKIYVDVASPHYFLRVMLSGTDTCVTGSSVSNETLDLSKIGQKLDIAVPNGYVDLQTLASG
jgi:hypothetical protein